MHTLALFLIITVISFMIYIITNNKSFKDIWSTIMSVTFLVFFAAVLIGILQILFPQLK